MFLSPFLLCFWRFLPSSLASTSYSLVLSKLFIRQSHFCVVTHYLWTSLLPSFSLFFSCPFSAWVIYLIHSSLILSFTACWRLWILPTHTRPRPLPGPAGLPSGAVFGASLSPRRPAFLGQGWRLPHLWTSSSQQRLTHWRLLVNIYGKHYRVANNFIVII